MMEAPTGLESPTRVAILLGVGSAMLAAAQLVLWVLGGSLAGLCVRLRASAAVDLGVALIVGASFAPALGWPVTSRFGQDLVLGLAVLVAAVGSAALAALLSGWVGSARRARLGEALALAAPWVGIASCVFVWFEIYRIEGWSSAESLGAMAGWATVSIGCVVAFYAMELRNSWSTWAAVLAVGVASLLPAAREHGTPVASAPEHPTSCGILLTVDTLRADALRAFAPEAAPHPHLDKLFGESVVFTQARSAGPWTKPAFASLLTGLPVSAHGASQTDSRLPSAVRTLAEYLREAGYVTVGVGNNPFLTPSFGFDQGFDRYRFFPRPTLGSSLGAWWFVRTGLYRQNATTDQLTDVAIAWLRELSGRPFFLWLHILDPHVPYSPPPGYLPDGPAPPRIGNFWNGTSRIRSGAFVPDADERRWLRALYDAELRFVDDNVGRLMAAVDELGLERCVLAFASDHGEEFWDHGGYEHGHSLYDEVIRVPLAFRLPQETNKGSIAAPVSTESMTATLLELLGADAGSDAELAPSLATYWTEPELQPPSSALVSTGMLVFSQKRAVIQDGLKVIEDLQSREVEIYDLARDPGEQHSLEDTAEAARRARATLTDWTKQGERMKEALGIRHEVTGAIEGDLADQLRAIGYAE
jgi:arylsulfatase A-like enzyme